MSGNDPFGLVIALALIMGVAAFGGLVTWIYDQVCIFAGWRVHPDVCLTCGTRLRRAKGRNVYRPHRCRPRC